MVWCHFGPRIDRVRSLYFAADAATNVRTLRNDNTRSYLKYVMWHMERTYMRTKRHRFSSGFPVCV